MSRYDVSGLQNSYQEGSDGEVLANKLGIVRREDMNEAELMLLRKLYFSVLREHPVQGPITVRLIRGWHRRWLGNIYRWAGQERSVNMSKDGFPFAAADRIPSLLDEYERRFLGCYTPCAGMGRADLAEAIAVTHVEFILIHPFREGNGRISRLMADVMAQQAGWGPLDYSTWEADRPRYIAAIQSGLGGDYAWMRDKVEEALGRQPV
ncbi:Fic family protein [Castellaniella sp. GW247-6E4]|uniref:Fic/DOC family protein n=1 Tax=Castellaniella sp. GW247-6E4 TaxID=3140380 RepID=UPI003314C0CD